MPTSSPCEHPEDLQHGHDARPDAIIDAVAQMGAAMSDPSRLRVLELLFDGRHCVSELAIETDSSMSAVSQRLKSLHQARLVLREREGKHIFYSLADDHIRDLLERLFAHAAE